VHPAFVIGGSLTLATIGFTILTQVSAGGGGLAPVVAGCTLIYLGLGPVFTLGTDLIVGAAPPERAGAAAALSETSSEFGGALGIAVLGSLGTALYRGDMARAALDHVPAGVRQAAGETLGGAVAAAGGLSAQAAAPLLGAAREAFAHAFQVTAGVCAVVAAVTAVVATIVLRRVGQDPGRAPGDQPAPALCLAANKPA
jgi:MFS transporter, DHA2 family, multidrug resistance protein